MGKKVIIVTGGTRGIGGALCDYFLKSDCIVVFSGTSEASVSKAKAYYDKTFDEDLSLGVIANIIDPNACDTLVEKCIEKYGKLDIFINNAGIEVGNGDFLDVNPDQISLQMDVNIKGSMYGTLSALKYFKSVGRGSVYLMEGFGSDGRVGNGMTLYGTSKYAIRYFIKSLANELKGTDIVIGALSPGMVTTDLLMKPLKDMDEKTAKRTMDIFRILADKKEDVAQFLGENILANKKQNPKIFWLTGGKVMFRFIFSKFLKRNPFDENDI